MRPLFFKALLTDGSLVEQTEDDVSRRHPEVLLTELDGTETVHTLLPETCPEVLQQIAAGQVEVAYQGRLYHWRRFPLYADVEYAAERGEVVEFALVSPETGEVYSIRLLPSEDPEYQPGDMFANGAFVPFCLDPSLMAQDAQGRLIRPEVRLRYGRELEWKGEPPAMELHGLVYCLGWHVDLPDGTGRDYYMRIR
jgi:hypothetical protein